MSRKRATPLKPQTIVKVIALCVFVCLSGIGYVWAKTEVYGLNKEIKALEVRLEKLRNENAALERAHAALCTPAALDARVRDMELGLTTPQPDQLVRMVEPRVPAPGSGQTRVYAVREE